MTATSILLLKQLDENPVHLEDWELWQNHDSEKAAEDRRSNAATRSAETPTPACKCNQKKNHCEVAAGYVFIYVL